MLRIAFFTSLISLLISCDAKQDSTASPTNLAIAVYNQAYQENFEADKIVDILKNAHNAYVLIDPFTDQNHISIPAIQANGNQVAVYISIGTGETYRSYFDLMQPFLVTTPWSQWPEEYFVNSTTTGILDLMKLRIDQLAIWGCDWVEFDNMDWIFDEDLRSFYGFEVTEEEGIAYYQELCDYVHQKGMKCMAKNTVVNASNFDGVLYESSTDEKNWWDAIGAQSFLNAGKLVIINHYNETNCGQVYSEYKGIYNDHLSFICEDANLQRYVHFNQF